MSKGSRNKSARTVDVQREEPWFRNRRKRNRVRDKMQKASRKANRLK
jgi:hypothetical protein